MEYKAVNSEVLKEELHGKVRVVSLLLDQATRDGRPLDKSEWTAVAKTAREVNAMATELERRAIQG